MIVTVRNLSPVQQVEVMTLLHRCGADIHARADCGSTPLHWATYMGHLPATEKLLEYKGNAFHKTKNGLTSLHMAAMNGHRLVRPFHR